MLRARVSLAPHVAFVGALAFAVAARAQEPGRPGALTEVPLPGGLSAALAALGDPVPGDRSQFLLEIIHRSYNLAGVARDGTHNAAVQALLAHLDQSANESGATVGHDTLPLPLSAAIWTHVVFGDRVSAQNLVAAILRSRGAARLYIGLLSLDDSTRAWLATQPDLIEDIASQYSVAFLVAAPGFRVAQGVVQVPGGKLAEPVWEALVGSPVNEPVAFARALIKERAGRFAIFFGAMATLTPAQLRFAFGLNADVSSRVEAARRLRGVFDRLATQWNVEGRTFWRPVLDPALLVADLRADQEGRPMLPGTRRFWSAVLAAGGRGAGSDTPQALAQGEPVDIAWLCEQIFREDSSERRALYHAVLFASRRVGQVTPQNGRDAVDAVRAAANFPALVAALERAGLDDLSAFASVARRAAQLSEIDNEAAGPRALAEFQGALVLVTRAAWRGSLSRDSLPGLVSSLSAVELSDRGEFQGRMVRWLKGNLPQDLIPLLAGPAPAEPRFVDWEGTRYRLDLAAPEAARLDRTLDEDGGPYLASARTVVEIADDLISDRLTRARVQQHASALEQLANTLALADRCHQMSAELQRIARGADLKEAARLAPSLLSVADDLLARGLTELAYTIAIGQPDAAPLSVADVASRHDFGLQSGARRLAPWQLPIGNADDGRGWHVSGSLLGLESALTGFSLIRVSLKPPPRPPSLNVADRSVFIEGVALVRAASLTDSDRDKIVAAIQRGRARIAAAGTPAEAASLADEIRLSPARRTLLEWVVVHDRERAPAFLSPLELLWAGLEQMPVPESLHAWGAAAEPRLGCLCTQLPDPRSLEFLAGRWSTGMLATGFPDLNLRLAELLADLQMPASLLGFVLASATLEFVDTAVSRDPDDRRGLVEYVRALDRGRLEQYLATLTTDGPLVPVTSLDERLAGLGVQR